jgi:Transcriptional regulator/sugar kinase
MENINLRSIKCESIKAIFNSITSADKISRADISAQTGLSLMTVGKVVDALLNLNIICQSKEVKSIAGRKAGLININKDHFCVILDLTSKNFVMIVIDIHLGVVDKMKYAYDTNSFYEDNFYIFLKNVQTYLNKKLNMDNCVGIGISLPGAYIPEKDVMLNSRIPDLLDLNIKKIVSGIIKHAEIFIESSVNVAALSNITRIPDHEEKNILYWFIGEDNIGGAVVVNGEILHGAHHGAGDFSRIIVSEKKGDLSGCSLEAAIKKANTIEDAALDLAKAIANVMRVIDPHIIILECELYNNTEYLIELINKDLVLKMNINSANLPEFMTGGCKFRHSHRGLALKLREKWLDKIIRSQI